MGKKGDDMNAISLCAECHRTGTLSQHAMGSWDAFAKFWDIDPDEIRANLQARYRRVK